MDDDKIIKFQRPNPKKEAREAGPLRRKALIWLMVVATLVAVWSYYQFVSPPSLPGQ